MNRKTGLKIGIGALAGLLILPLLVLGGLVLFVSTFLADPDELTELCRDQYGGSTSATSVTAPDIPENLWSFEQRTNARTIYLEGRKRPNLTDEDFALALMVAIQESKLINLGPGQADADSVGLFGQRPSQGWGSVTELMNPVYSSNAFYDALEAFLATVSPEAREQLTPLDIALAVQRPSREAYLSPQNYFPDWEPIAYSMIAVVSKTPYGGGGTVDVPAYVCERLLGIEERQITALEAMVRAALEEVGEPYDGETPPTGATLLSQAAKTAGFTLPDTLDELMALADKKADGVSAEFIPIDELETVERSDLPLISTDGDSEPDQIGIATGLTGGELRLGTYNVLGSTHTSDGSGEPGVVRIEKAIRLIDDNDPTVVGLQELQADQRAKLIGQLRPLGYEIYPTTPNYGAKGGAPPRIHSDNSIIWDTTQVTKIGEASLRMPHTHDGIQRLIPLVLFRDIDTQQEFYVTNTHDPAGPDRNHPYLRFVNAGQHALDMDELTADGTPVFFTGDFNSGFGLRGPKLNSTYQNKRENLTWCIMTKSGSMVNAYDAFKGRGGIQADGTVKACPQQTTNEMGVGPVDHIYVSDGVEVSDWRITPVNRAVTGSDHPVVWADVTLPSDGSDSSDANQDEPSKFGSYVGVSSDGNIVLDDIPRPKLVGVLRLTIEDEPLAGSGDWVLFMAPDTFTYTGNTYGPRVHPITGELDFHNGMDVSAACGTPLYAMNDGVVTDVGGDSAWGNYVVIDYGARSSVYAHMPSEASVDIGNTVKSGQQVGEVGTTGLSNGCHLHFTVATGPEWKYGDQIGTENPILLLEQTGLVDDLG